MNGRRIMRAVVLLTRTIALAIALGGVAEGVVTTRTYAVLRVDSTNAETIVSIPWVDTTPRGAETAIAPSNLVLTIGLSAGDTLAYYNTTGSGQYELWHLATNEAGHLAWQPVQSVSSAAVTQPTERLMRGNALVLSRTGTYPDHFYLFGQVTTGGSSLTNVLPRSASGKVHSLLAPPDDKAVSPNAGAWSNVAAGDVLLLRGRAYRFVEGVWGQSAWDFNTFEETFAAMTEEIPRGQGAWFISAPGDSASPATVIWSGLPCAAPAAQ